jgi:hypothetical protein
MPPPPFTIPVIIYCIPHTMFSRIFAYISRCASKQLCNPETKDAVKVVKAAIHECWEEISQTLGSQVIDWVIMCVPCCVSMPLS